MWNTRYCIAMICLTCAVATAQVDIDFQRLYQALQAERIFHKGEYAKAQDAFQRLADTAADTTDQAKWASRVAVALGCQADRYDDGVAAAKLIDDPVYSACAQMELMVLKDKEAVLLKVFGKAPISDWPPRAMPRRPGRGKQDARAYAYYYRGCARLKNSDYASAEADLSRAGELAAVDAFGLKIWLLTADNRRQNLGDDAAAYEAYRHATDAGVRVGGSEYFRAVLACARYLAQQRKFDEAIEMLNALEPDTRTGAWGNEARLILGDVYIQTGRFDEGLHLFDRVRIAENVQSLQRDKAILAMGAALAGAGRIGEARVMYQRILEDETSSSVHQKLAREAIDHLSSSTSDAR